MITKVLTPTENTIVKVTEDTQYVLDFPSMQGEYVVDLQFEKQGVEAELIGMYVAGKGDDLKLTTIANHKVPHTKCTTNVKGVLLDKGKSSYIGKIIIAKPAQQTSSYLDDAVLVVGQDTQNKSQPILEIDADDVKASHGATTGRIDENQVYYLTSRGLSKKEASELIVDGFFESMLSTIADENIRNKVKSKLNVRSG